MNEKQEQLLAQLNRDRQVHQTLEITWREAIEQKEKVIEQLEEAMDQKEQKHLTACDSYDKLCSRLQGALNELESKQAASLAEFQQEKQKMTLQLNEKIAASDEEKQQAIDNMDKLTETLDRLQSQLDEVSQQLEKACEEILKKDQLVLDLQEQHEVFKQAGQVVVDDKTRLESMVEHLEQELVSWKQELTEFLSRRTEAYCS